MRKLNDAAFAVKEKEVFGVGDGEGRVGFFGAGGDFRADGADEDLHFPCQCRSTNTPPLLQPLVRVRHSLPSGRHADARERK